MADVYAVFGTLLALGIVYPGMLTAWRLIFPKWVEGARTRLERTPWRSLGLGVALSIPLGLVVAIFLSSPLGPANFLGGSLLVAALAFASLGASGLAAMMGRRIARLAAPGTSEVAGFVRGAVALELAAAFPVIGWFMVIPFTTVLCFGAATFAVLGWVPSAEDEPRPVTEVEEAAFSQA